MKALLLRAVCWHDAQAPLTPPALGSWIASGRDMVLAPTTTQRLRNTASARPPLDTGRHRNMQREGMRPHPPNKWIPSKWGADLFAGVDRRGTADDGVPSNRAIVLSWTATYGWKG